MKLEGGSVDDLPVRPAGSPLLYGHPGRAQRVVLPVVWTGAALGTVKSCFFPAPQALTASLYVLLGLVAAPFSNDVRQPVSRRSSWWRSVV